MRNSNPLLVALVALLGLEAGGIGVMAAKVAVARRNESAAAAGEAAARADVQAWRDIERAQFEMLGAEMDRMTDRRRNGEAP